jgi:signal transduction histidine kinase
MRRIWLFLVGVALLLAGQGVCARSNDDIILGQSFYEDKTNTLTYEQARSMVFTPYAGILTGGYSKGTYWIRLDLRANAQNMALKIRPLFTNEITLYDPASSRSPKTTGSAYPVKEADIQTNSLNFVLPPSTENRAVYLRIKSVSSYMVFAEAMPLTQFERSERTDNFIYTAYIMLNLILAVWMCVMWLMHRERVIGVFALQQLIALMHTFSRVGFLRSFFDHYMSDVLIVMISNGIVVVYPLVCIIANKLLLQEYGLKRVSRFIFNTTIAFSLVLITLNFSGRQQTALSTNALLVLFMMLWFWICALWGTDVSKAHEGKNGVQIKVLRVYYTFNLIVWIVALFPLIGILSTGSIALHSLLVYNITSSLFFFILLQYRARWLLKNEVSKASILAAEATQERQRREEQSMLMAMLSHEIKTPLSVLKLVMDQKVAGTDLEGHANRAVSNINFIVNRCLQLGKLDAKAIQLNPTKFLLKEFLVALLTDLQDASRVQVNVPNACYIRTDKEILRVVIGNLIENSLKYGDPDQPVVIQAFDTTKIGIYGIQINVRNAIGALGVPDADQVFKKYYRNTRATKVAGSGLGLFLVHELVSVMGGNVNYVSDNQEVTFSVWIPA